MYKSADDAQKDAENLRTEYEAKLSDAKKESDRIIREAVAIGHTRQEEIIQKADENAAGILAKANADIALERKRAVNEAKHEISDMAIAIASKVVEKELTDDSHRQLIDNFINELGDKS